VSCKRCVSLISLTVLAVALLGTVIYTPNLNIVKAQELNEEEVEKITKEVLSYVSTTREDDPFIEVESNIFIKESNYKGITINDQTYYYSLSPHMSYDPVSRGKMDLEDVNIIYNDNNAEIPVIIYTKRP
jgi:hydroxymethylpyrimidine pyrophosphatase-like HAD family hydrolase